MRFASTRRLLRTSSFRLALLYVVLFGVSGAVLLGIIYGAALVIVDRQTRETVEADVLGLAEHFGAEGLGGLITVVAARSSSNVDPGTVYLLAGPQGQALAGNLADWPAAAGPLGTWVSISLVRAERGRPTSHEVLARTYALPGGLRLLVGRDLDERGSLRSVMLRAFAWALGAMAVLGLIGGLVLSQRVLRRVEAVAAESRRIMRGDLTQRMPRDGSEDEFDRLAASLNDMLAQIERRMLGMRAVTDSLGHDLRSPLTRLKARAERALAGDLAPEDYRQALAHIMVETDAILATFRALVAIAEAEAGVAQAEFTVLDIGAVAANAAELYEPVAEEKGVRLTTALTAGLSAGAIRSSSPRRSPTCSTMRSSTRPPAAR